MKKPKIVLASILKPVDDTRIFEKFGISLSQTNKYDINIIGFCPKNLPPYEGITFYPIFSFKRLDFKRLFAPLKFLRLITKLKPKILIVNTHELLLVSFIYKILFGVKLLYDVQENYYRNILYTNAFPKLSRPLIAGYVRAKEYTSTLFVNHYLLAEKAYEEEFSFTKGKSSVIENKFKPLAINVTTKKNDEKVTLIFTGTLAESTGVFRAIELAKKLHNLDTSVELKIYGHCSQTSTLNKLKEAINNCNFIELTGGKDYVSHTDVLRAIKSADFGIINYPKNPSTVNSTPTKLYEYLGSELPILLENHEKWVALASKFNGCLLVDFENPDAETLLKKMQTSSFYDKGKKSELLWQNEEKKLLDIINNYTV